MAIPENVSQIYRDGFWTATQQTGGERFQPRSFARILKNSGALMEIGMQKGSTSASETPFGKAPRSWRPHFSIASAKQGNTLHHGHRTNAMNQRPVRQRQELEPNGPLNAGRDR